MPSNSIEFLESESPAQKCAAGAIHSLCVSCVSGRSKKKKKNHWQQINIASVNKYILPVI